jgi:hypothetical protein
MKVYTIYTDSEGNYEAIKQGWSWAAFGLTCLWAVSKKIWKISTVSISIFFILAVLVLVASAIMPEVAQQLSGGLVFIYVSYWLLGFSVLMGLNGNQWYENALPAQGYHYQEIFVAENANKAIALYINKSNENRLLIA